MTTTNDNITTTLYPFEESDIQLTEWINSLSDEAILALDHVHNFITILEEMQPSVLYTISKLENNEYQATVRLDGIYEQINEWKAVSSRPLLAKYHACKETVFFLVELFKANSRKHRFFKDDQSEDKNDTKLKITSDEPLGLETIKKSNRNKQKIKQQAETASQSTNDTFDPGYLSDCGTNIIMGERTVNVSGKGPMAVLNEVYPNLIYEMLLERGKCALETFTCRITLNGNTFSGNGRSKKLARSNAALSALESIYGKKFSSLQRSVLTDTLLPEGIICTSSLQIFVDKIACMVKDKFESLVVDDPSLQKRKVLAGIVQTSYWQLSTARVICVTTGTKCLNAEKMSSCGRVLKDCHAEITARRCLIRYLYENLLAILNNQISDNLILEPAQDSNGFRIKENVQFHIFVSTSPCGDGRVFSIHEGDHNDGSDIHPNRKARGQLRKKIEAGEGTVLINPGPYVQTWDAVISGEPLQTMSCSDKMCRWNITGVQGSLLSCFIEPTYLASVIVGNLFHADHLKRALYGRIEKHITVLPKQFKLTKPLLARVSYSLPRLPRKAPFIAFIWYQGLNESIQEVVNAETGILDSGEISKFSRSSLFDLWKRLLGKLPMRQLASEHLIEKAVLYSDCKLLSSDYLEAKYSVSKAFAKAGLGIWVTKPSEQDLFT